jgi:CrcB protein
MNILYVFIGGGIGCVFRFVLSALFVRWQVFSFPWATLLANTFSCVVFAAAVYFLGEKALFTTGSYVRPLIITGFCGGLSTFSTFSFETFELLKRGDFTMAGVNILLNMVLCLAIFAFLARR